jgi:hypothetical protein
LGKGKGKERGDKTRKFEKEQERNWTSGWQHTYTTRIQFKLQNLKMRWVTKFKNEMDELQNLKVRWMSYRI